MWVVFVELLGSYLGSALNLLKIVFIIIARSPYCNILFSTSHVPYIIQLIFYSKSCLFFLKCIIDSMLYDDPFPLAFRASVIRIVLCLSRGGDGGASLK